MVKRRVRVSALKVVFLAGVMSLAAKTTSYAGPLNLSLADDPVMNAQSITSTFNASTGLFQASGWAVFWTGKDSSQSSLSFKLTANFSGGVPTSATLLVGSESAPFVSASGLSDFAFEATKGGTIEFLFDTVGGSSGVFSSTAPLDVQIKVSSTFTPQFTTSWMNSQETAILRQPEPTTDPVPEPSSLLALVVGGGGLLLRRRRAARKAAQTIA